MYKWGIGQVAQNHTQPMTANIRLQLIAMPIARRFGWVNW